MRRCRPASTIPDRSVRICVRTWAPPFAGLQSCLYARRAPDISTSDSVLASAAPICALHGFAIPAILAVCGNPAAALSSPPDAPRSAYACAVRDAGVGPRVALRVCVRGIGRWCAVVRSVARTCARCATLVQGCASCGAYACAARDAGAGSRVPLCAHVRSVRCWRGTVRRATRMRAQRMTPGCCVERTHARRGTFTIRVYACAVLKPALWPTLTSTPMPTPTAALTPAPSAPDCRSIRILRPRSWLSPALWIIMPHVSTVWIVDDVDNSSCRPHFGTEPAFRSQVPVVLAWPIRFNVDSSA